MTDDKETGYTDCRVGKDDWSTSSPLATDTEATSKCSAPILAVEDLEEGRAAGSGGQLQFSFDTVLYDAIFVFLKVARKLSFTTVRTLETYDIISSNIAVETEHGTFRLFMLALARVVDVRFWNKPNKNEKHLKK